MAALQIRPVRTESDWHDFLHLPLKIYRHHPAWIRPLDKDVRDPFRPEKNRLYGHGSAAGVWLAIDGGEVVGRIAAFVNKKKYAYSFDYPVGGMGFFESVDDARVAFALFDRAREWLEARGMKAMDGPINFGEKDRWWGLIIDNFTDPPYYCQNFNPDYYVSFFEQYGFKIFYKQYLLRRPVNSELSEKYIEKAERLRRDGNYRVVTIRKKYLPRFAEDFRRVYNRAWVKHESQKEMTRAQAMAVMKALKPIIDEDLIYFTYYKDEPVGFFISIPEINEVVRYLNGRLDLWGKVKFFYYLKVKKVVRTAMGLVFGVVPEHQGKGMEGLMVDAARRRVVPKGKYDRIITNWVGDFNPKMLHIVENMGMKRYRTMATYRYIFDSGIPFARAPIIA